MTPLWENFTNAWAALASGFFWKSTLLLTLACCAGYLMRRASAAHRHYVWTLATVCVLALPAVSISIPSWQAPVPASSALIIPQGAAVTRVPLTARGPEPVSKRPLLWAPGIWLAGFLFLTGRLLGGLARVSWLARISRKPHAPAGGTWDRLLVESSARIGLRRRVTLLEAPSGSMPITVGLFRPKILLPGEARYWSAERLRLVLLHELIHVQRADWLAQLLTQAAVAVYWFNPLVWFLNRQSRKDREHACDDGVIAAGVKASSYASHLLEIARSFQSLPQQAVPASMAMARWSGLEIRLRALLDASVNRRTVPRRFAALGAILAAVILLPLAALRAPAQTDTSTVAGTVTDASRAVVPAAHITLLNLDNGHREAMLSGETGQFSFSSLTPGKYRLEVAMPGFALFQRSFNVDAGAHVRLDAMLELGRISENVDVVGRSGRPVQKPSGPQRIRVGGNVQASKLISQVKPEYPQSAKDQGIQGAVVLQAVIATDGSLMSVSSLNSQVDSQLVDAALGAVKQWRYQPTLLNGQPVEVVTTITVNFRLE